MATVKFIDLRDEIKRDAWGLSFFPWQGRLHEIRDLLKTFHLISIQPGYTRGNHLHPGHVEWLYPFHGNGLLLWEADPGQIQQKFISGDSILIFIPPGIAHAVKNPGPEILYLLAWREEAAGAAPNEPETVRHEIKD